MLRFSKNRSKIIQECLNYLNTSHVKVQLLFEFVQRSSYVYLNTSHVKVQQNKIKTGKMRLRNLNTSHVKVQPFRRQKHNATKKFKYISC